MNNLELIFPEIFLSLSIMFLLILGVFKKNSSKIIHNISLLVLLITAVITFNETVSINRSTLFNQSIVIDYLSSFMKIITLIAAFVVLLISSNYLRTFKIFKIEYPILILSSVLGMMIMISSNDLIVFYMGLELQSLALYVLATFNIITTNKNKTATAPTYTINIIIPKNSAPIIIKRHEILIKSKIKKKTECTVFFETVTMMAEMTATIEKK